MGLAPAEKRDGTLNVRGVQVTAKKCLLGTQESLHG